MTGTAITEAEEFFDIYKLNVTSIPTNKKMVRKDFNDLIYRSEEEKYNAILKKLSSVNPLLNQFSWELQVLKNQKKFLTCLMIKIFT